MKKSVFFAFILVAIGCSNTENEARSAFDAFAKRIDARLPELVAEYDEDGGRTTKLTQPMVTSFDKAGFPGSPYVGAIRFGTHTSMADGKESDMTMLSVYQYEDGNWVCKKFEITTGENEPVKVMGEDLRQSAETSKLGAALVNVGAE